MKFFTTLLTFMLLAATPFVTDAQIMPDYEEDFLICKPDKNPTAVRITSEKNLVTTSTGESTGHTHWDDIMQEVVQAQQCDPATENCPAPATAPPVVSYGPATVTYGTPIVTYSTPFSSSCMSSRSMSCANTVTYRARSCCNGGSRLFMKSAAPTTTMTVTETVYPATVTTYSHNHGYVDAYSRGYNSHGFATPIRSFFRNRRAARMSRRAARQASFNSQVQYNTMMNSMSQCGMSSGACY
jgi:hypothetical protein